MSETAPATALMDHLADWSGDLTTRSGLQIGVRPVSAADEALLAEFFTHVSKDDLRFRFLSGLEKVGADQIARLTHVDHARTEDFLAFDGDLLVATAMVAADPAFETAEVAIAMREDYRGRGVGWTLLRHVARFAKAKGLRKLVSIESRANSAAIDLEREMGFRVTPCAGDSTLVSVEADLATFET